MKNLKTSSEIAKNLNKNLKFLSDFHYKIRSELYDKDLGDYRVHLQLLRKLDSLQKRAKSLLYHKSNIYKKIRLIDFSGLEKGQSFEYRNIEIEFEFNSFLFNFKSLLDIYAKTIEIVFWQKVQSGRFKKLLKELDNGSDSNRKTAEQIKAVINNYWEHLSLYLSDEENKSKRDILTHHNHLNYSMCIYGLDSNGNKYYKFPSEAGDDMWVFTDTSITTISGILKDTIPMLTDFYLQNINKPENLSEEEILIKREIIMSETMKSCVFKIEDTISKPIQISRKKKIE